MKLVRNAGKQTKTTRIIFFILFSDFYIFGESYGGKYVPALSHRIHLAKKHPLYAGPVDINLVGLGIGNGWMVPEIQGKYAAYLFYHGFLDQQQYEALYDLEDSLVRQVRPIRGQFRDQFERNAGELLADFGSITNKFPVLWGVLSCRLQIMHAGVFLGSNFPFCISS